MKNPFADIAPPREIWRNLRREWRIQKADFSEWRAERKERKAADRLESAYIKHYTSQHERLLVFDQREAVRGTYLVYLPRQVLADELDGLHRIVPERNKDRIMRMALLGIFGGALALVACVIGILFGMQITTLVPVTFVAAALGLLGGAAIPNSATAKPIWVVKRRADEIRAIDPVDDIGHSGGQPGAELLYKRTNRSTIGRAIALMSKSKQTWEDALPLGILAAINGGMAFGAYLLVTS